MCRDENDLKFKQSMAVSEFGTWLLEQSKLQDKFDKIEIHNFIVGNLNKYPDVFWKT